ncbi:MAG: ComEC/Rec2 family competence protein [Bacteroidales bacterium]|nr:ComEC/Rec2 family competence protein [Bacteroidales bacterium]
MKGCDTIILCSAGIVAGCIVFGVLPPSPAVLITAALLSLGLTAVLTLTRIRVLVSVIFFCLGGISAQIGGLDFESSELRLRAEHSREAVSQYLASVLPPGSNDEAAILRAIAIGDRSALTRDIKRDFKRSGAMHILALSGMHIGVLYALLSLTLSFMGKSRHARVLRTAIILLCMWSYAVIAGLGSSIMRAVVMITVYESGGYFHSRRNILRALAISALVACICNPSSPFGIGFQLSYGAMAGIHFVYPKLRSLLYCRSVIMEKLRDLLALTLSAQCFTAPLVLLYFGTFPRFFMVTNLFATPLASIAIYLTPLAGLTHGMEWLGPLLGRLLGRVLHLLYLLIHIIAG